MTALHLVFQHWFISLLLIWWGVTPLVLSVGSAIGRARGVRRLAKGAKAA